MLTSRPAEMHDLTDMKALLSANKRRNPHSGFHIGDLDWWIFYDPDHMPLSSIALLWYEDGLLIGWTLEVYDYHDYHVMMHPDFHGSPQEAEILVYLEEGGVRTHWRDEIAADVFGLYAFGDETGRIELLQNRGYQENKFIVCFAQDLMGELPPPQLPEGFTFLKSMHIDHVEQRASVHRGAFTQSKMTGNHFSEFMQTSQAYDPSLDIIVVAPDGAFAAYALTWQDPDSKVGAFEPVGTHHAYQRRGLGKAALLEGLRRLQAKGMEVATVFTGAEQDDNIAFYHSAGFQIVNYLPQYTKRIK